MIMQASGSILEPDSWCESVQVINYASQPVIYSGGGGSQPQVVTLAKKTCAANWRQPQGLSNPRVALFAGKRACGKLDTATGIVKSMDDHFR